jgi:haloalkane dehalogenase
MNVNPLDHTPRKDIVRTPEDRFQNLLDYPFKPNYFIINNIRIHYIDEGSKEADPVLLLHGEPSWSYLYRKMIPPLMQAGHRVIVPDLMGFGKSDKPIKKKSYTHQKHVNTILELVKSLNLSKITLFCQDWGGLIGLRVVGEEPQRFSRIIAGNTGFPAVGGIKGFIMPYYFRYQIWRKGKVTAKEFQKKPSFHNWVAYSHTIPDLPIGNVINGGTVTKLSEEVIKAYEAPYPDENYKAGAKIFPMLVPSETRKNYKAWKKVFLNWEKPFLTTFSDKDPITRGQEKFFQKKIPGAQKMEHITIKNAGHFLQEDKGEELAEIIINLIKST